MNKYINMFVIKYFLAALLLNHAIATAASPSSYNLASSELESALSKDPDRYVVPLNILKDDYRLVKALSGGKSGSGVFLIESKTEPGQQRILKTLNQIKNFSNIFNDIGFREIYFSKKLSELGSTKYSAPHKKDSIFFPQFYGFGFTQAFNPFLALKSDQEKIPFYIMEKLDGLSFLDFATKPDDARAKFSYDLKSAPKGVIFSILFQVTLALYNAYKAFGFVHLDAHPGNIFLVTSPASANIFDIDGVKIRPLGPQVKIIDFDQSEIEKLRPTPRPIYKYRPYLGGEWELFKAENQTSIPPLKLSLNAYEASQNPDVRMVNFLIHAFKQRFIKEANLDVSGLYFHTLEQLLKFFVENAHRFGLVVKN